MTINRCKDVYCRREVTESVFDVDRAKVYEHNFIFMINILSHSSLEKIDENTNNCKTTGDCIFRCIEYLTLFHLKLLISS